MNLFYSLIEVPFGNRTTVWLKGDIMPQLILSFLLPTPCLSCQCTDEFVTPSFIFALSSF